LLFFEIKENDESFNEESIKKYISYFNFLRDEKNFLYMSLDVN
jgi:hypothetical protein